jgi:hypothetical protein
MRHGIIDKQDLLEAKALFYLHTNGEVISKPPIVAMGDPEYFVSDFVRGFWIICNDDNWADMATDLSNLGVDIPERV